VQALLEEVPVEGRVVTVDAQRTTGDTARGIVETHGADRLMMVKANAPETFGMPGTTDRERDATGTFGEERVGGKVAIMGARERGGKIVMEPVGNVDGQTAAGFARKHSGVGATIHTYESRFYKKLSFRHESVNHS